MEVPYAQVNRLAEVVILVYKLGLAQLAQSIEKNVMDLKYLHHDRAFATTDGVYGEDRAGFLQRESWGLHDKGPGSFNDHPRHGLGGGGVGVGQDRVYGPWTEGGSMSKLELPDLPESSSPLQFGDWLHLSTPVMKDLSGVADWWWESTLREAKCYYEQWKQSTPLQRIQINPRLPEDLCEHKFQRTEQRGIQMLLKAIPLAEQQTLVTDRALSSTAILYKLLVRFQPGGAGEKANFTSTAHLDAKADNDSGGGWGIAQLAQALWTCSGSPGGFA